MTAFYEDLHVVELGDDAAAYIGRLFADLGAAVTRVDAHMPISGRLSTHDPATDLFLHRRKRRVDGSTVTWPEILPAQLVVTSNLSDAERHAPLDTFLAEHDDVVHVRISYFGTEGPLSAWKGSDLTVAATGGFLGLAGYPGKAPTRAWGDQSLRMASLHAAVGASLALFHRQRTGRGQVVDVSVQEAVATALENALQFYDLEGVIRRRKGSGYSEAGTGVYACRDGLVYLMAGRLSTRVGWTNLVSWLRDEGIPGAEDLATEKWQDHDFRATAEAEQTFRAIFEDFASERAALDLYRDSQSRHIVLCPVSNPVQLLDNEHLRAREFFVEESGHVYPALPYRCRPASDPSGRPARHAPEGGPPS